MVEQRYALEEKMRRLMRLNYFPSKLCMTEIDSYVLKNEKLGEISIC